MNYDLAAMALDGLARTPITIRVGAEGIEVEGSGSAFKELARLCLLLGAEGTAAGELFELHAPMHLAAASPAVRLRRTS